MTGATPLADSILPSGLRSRIVPGVNGLECHILEAGDATYPALLLLHGFPELAYSWRKVMGPLAAAGYHVIAPDLRGYGRTSPEPIGFADDLAPFGILNLVRDCVALVSLLGIDRVAGVIGHDVGASVAAACALVRPDLFRSVAIMSAPFTGAPAWPLPPSRTNEPINEALAALDPPRKHYQAYFATAGANDDMWRCRQGVPAFLRAYYHCKSGDWPDNQPVELDSWSAEELARMPPYYIMPLAESMAEAVAPELPVGDVPWLTRKEFCLYSGEYERTGFQGGLQWYRGRLNGSLAQQLALYSGATIDVPALFLAGSRDWGPRQVPGALERMSQTAFTRMQEPCFIEGAGHWVQQEKPVETAARLIEFLR